MSDKVVIILPLTPSPLLDTNIKTLRVKSIRKLLYLWWCKKTQLHVSQFDNTKHTKGMALEVIRSILKDTNNIKCSRRTAEHYNQALIILEEIDIEERRIKSKIDEALRGIGHEDDKENKNLS